MGVTIVVITHDREIAGRLGRRIEMLDGQIVFDSADKSAAVRRPPGAAGPKTRHPAMTTRADVGEEATALRPGTSGDGGVTYPQAPCRPLRAGHRHRRGRHRGRPGTLVVCLGRPARRDLRPWHQSARRSKRPDHLRPDS